VVETLRNLIEMTEEQR